MKKIKITTNLINQFEIRNFLLNVDDDDIMMYKI